MRSILIFTCLLLTTLLSAAKNTDTLHVQPQDLNIKNLQTGNYSYIIFYKKTKESPASHIFLIKINVEQQLYHDRPAYVVKQEWDVDTVVHAAYSVFNAKTFATVLHNTFWKSLGYWSSYDFDAKKVEFKNVSAKGGIPDSVKSQSIADFNDSFKKYCLNWHADLLIYQMLPYQDKRTFVINYYDPGFGKAEEASYTVTGSDTLMGRDGEKIDCWVLNYNDNQNPSVKRYERFWIAKKTNEVLKEEDFSERGYRYKIKIGISGDQ